MPQAKTARPYYPIIYVRGYAGGQAEVEDTVADPYMGFNLGSTKIRQVWSGDVKRHYFESPLVRLMKDHGYRDVYEGGTELPQELKVGQRSIFIYRYYDAVSTQLGTGKRGEIVDYAKGLDKLILDIRDRIAGDDARACKDFKVYLVAHSMGGLICRCFLQNPEVSTADARGCVDKVFTYATPHNGIDIDIVGNIPGFFTRNNVDNFNRKKMRTYLGLPPGADDDSVASLDGHFDPDRFFCLVGTDNRDYGAAGGLARRAVGRASDGLVRIANATVFGPRGSGQRIVQAPRAFVHRSHSGHYGIVNSEEGYQNMTRFLFGNVRVDGYLNVRELTLPPKVQRRYDNGERLRASYHFEVIVRTRGAQWDLHRRTNTEDSAIFRRFDELSTEDDSGRHPLLFSVFLSTSERMRAVRSSLGFSIDLGILVPQYEIDRKLWFDDHYDGGYLFRDKINIEALPPSPGNANWRLRHSFDSKTPNRATKPTKCVQTAESIRFEIDIKQPTRPGIKATLNLIATPWNTDW